MSSTENEVIGGSKNFWLYSRKDGWDITHPSTPTSPLIYPRIKLETTKEPVTIDSTKAALVIVDLQNYFLSPALGRPTDAGGLKAVEKLLSHAIPACRKAGIPILWLNWGLEERDIEEMPPAITHGFSLGASFVNGKTIGKLGEEIGEVTLEDGTKVDGGRVLMREQWNSEVYGPLKAKRKPQDMLVHKNRLSGFWGGTGVEEVLEERGIRTLLFAGVNTDQCVGGSMQDASAKGWDILMLSDGCATTSPRFARECIEYNCERGMGFLLSCEQFSEGVKDMQKAPLT